MKIKELVKKIETTYPLSTALDFDNTGASILDKKAYVKGVLVCLDVTMNAIEYAYKNNINLIISHHPLIFNPIRSLNDDVIARRVKRLIECGINTYSIHTNFDTNIKYGMGSLFVDKLFKSKEIKKHDYIETFDKNHAIGDIITLKKPIFIDSLKNKVLDAFHVSKDTYAYYRFGKDMVSKIIILPGSGSSDVDNVIKTKCDCFITSDLKHNHLVDLSDAKISYINPTHFAMENIFVPYIESYIKKIIKTNVLTFSSVAF